MKQLLIIFFAFCLLTSCNKRVVQLPETTNKDITEVIDVSPVYMFYDEETDSVEFNRRNIISSTNWLVNIDKRLTLKQILPHLQYLQEKRQGDGMHKNDKARNYFTCNNTDLKNLSFIEFTDVVYHEEYSGDYFSKISDIQKNEALIIHINSSGEISTMIIKNDKPSSYTIEKENFLDIIKDLTNENTESIEILINYDSNLSFQDYIDFKTLLLDLEEDYSLISNHEFIHN